MIRQDLDPSVPAIQFQDIVLDRCKIRYQTCMKGEVRLHLVFPIFRVYFLFLIFGNDMNAGESSCDSTIAVANKFIATLIRESIFMQQK